MKQGVDPTRPIGPGNPPADTQFKPGQSGNPNGRPPTKAVEEAFQDFLYAVAKSKDGQERQRLEVIMARLFSDAAGGKHQAANILLERAFGKAKQPLSHEGGDPNKPIVVASHKDKELLDAI